MTRHLQVFLLSFALLTQSLAVAATAPQELSCRELFLQPILSTNEKLNFLKTGILNETRDAFKNYNILPLDRRGQKQLQRFLKKLDFEKIRSNDIFNISQIMSDRHAPLLGQIKLALTRKIGEARANIVLNRLTNQLIFMSLYRSFEKEGRIQDLGILTRYKVHLHQHFAAVHAFAASIFTVYSIFTGITVGDFRGIVLPQLQLLKFKNLPSDLQDHILDGIDQAIPAVIAHSGQRVAFETAYDIAFRSFYMILSTATIIVIANMILEKMFGYRANDVLDDLFFRQALEKAAGDSVIDGLSGAGVEFDETYVRQQVHLMGLKNLKTHAQN